MEANPIATEEQREHERRALALTRQPAVRAAFDRVRSHWLEGARPGAEMRACFDAAFAEVMFSAAVWSLNQDPLRPKVITISRLEHWLGDVRVPGSRWGIDNPDSIYRVIPVSGGERYLIRGRVAAKRLAENYFTLWDKKMNTVAVLRGDDLECAPDRSFVITVDGEAAAGRPNHIRSSPQAHEFYIRDVLLDWAADTPNELRVERLGDAPATAPLSADAQARLTADFMLRYADNTMRWNAQALDRPVNEIGYRIDRDSDGALGNQIYILGHFRLEDDEALIIHVRTGGARYFVAPITNLWGTTNDVVHRTGSLNSAQSQANPDGSYSYVLSPRDPGVHNWLDPCAMHEGILTLRWAEFPAGRPEGGVEATSQVVAFSKLRDFLPAGTKFVSPEERAAQCAARAAGYLRRLRDD